ncbi:hypothetical protein MMC07_005876, partial [Pseudocyphellaria aurata]|nr:hypothetical protein [Pseudocyphellaria aurata]
MCTRTPTSNGHAQTPNSGPFGMGPIAGFLIPKDTTENQRIIDPQPGPVRPPTPRPPYESQAKTASGSAKTAEQTKTEDKQKGTSS